MTLTSTAKIGSRPWRLAITLLVMAASSLFLLIYIGHAEAQRNYLKFVLDGVIAQGRIVQNSMEGYLRPGLPLRQYVGFNTLARAISDSDDAISRMFVVDLDQRLIFASSDSHAISVPARTSNPHLAGDAVEISRFNGHYHVILPLRNKFEIVGSLIVEVPRGYVSLRVQDRFRELLIAAIVLAVVFAAIATFWRTRRRLRGPWLAVAYGATFLAMATLVVATLIALYSDGVQSKTKALGQSLAQRLSDLVSFNLKIDDFDGLDHVFRDYRRLNQDISEAALTVNGVIRVHTNASLVGRSWANSSAAHEYKVDLSQPSISANKVELLVAVPKAVVYDQVLRTVKNFAALFVASAVLAWLIMQLAGTLSFLQDDSTPDKPNNLEDGARSSLELVKPIFFIAVFFEHLAYPFLPQFILESLRHSNTPDSFVSLPFMAYYLCFALALIPAGRYAQQFGPRRVMTLGLSLAALGLFGLGLEDDIVALTLARALAGIGQGMLFMGVQSYILETAPPEHTTRGAASLVVGFQGGMISGTAIGSLLVGYIGGHGIFALAGCLAVAVTIYAVCLVPDRRIRPSIPPDRIGAWRTLVKDLTRLLPNSGFLRTVAFIGIPAKAVMTGFVIFALPLLLSRMNYSPEDIGQIIMLYAIGVLVTCLYCSRLVDRIGRSEAVLSWGAAASGLGLLITGLSAWEPVTSIGGLQTILLLAGTLMLGTAHGFILAPVVTRIAECEAGNLPGIHSAVTTYRFIERIGHVLGPIIMGQLLMLTHHSITVATISGVGVLLLALAYSLGSQHAMPRAAR